MEVSDVSSRILADLLEARTGQHLTISRRWRIETALKSLMRARGLTTLDQLIATLVSGGEPRLGDEIVEALLNNETYFYRDRAPFDMLINGVLPRLRESRPNKRISIWCAGCSTGQEVYSLAMSFADAAAKWDGWRIDILGTDVSGAAIDQARSGIYSQFEVQRGLPVVQMIRWFDEIGDTKWQVSPKLRDTVRFRTHSLMDPPPRPGAFDIILCRNVLLYFSSTVRRIVFDRLREASAPDATLMLGAGETVIGNSEEFASDPEFRGLYHRVPAGEQKFARRA